MSTRQSQRKRVIDKVIAVGLKKLKAKEANVFADFLRLYFKNIPHEELVVHETDVLYAKAKGHWDFINQRKGKKPAIRIFNPTLGNEGWESEHTIIEIVMDDMPFIVDSVRMEINRLVMTSYVFINVAGVRVKRKGTCVEEINPSTDAKVGVEAYLHMEISHQTEAKRLKEIADCLSSVLKDVSGAVLDWRPMQEKMRQGMDHLQLLPASLIDPEEKAEIYAFLQWILEYFTFLGYREYTSQGKGNKQALVLVKKSGLGVLRDSAQSKTKRYYSDLPVETRKFMLSKKDVFWITKTNTRSTVHRPAYTDYLCLKLFDAKENICGEMRFVGLFTSDAYDSDPSRIPLLRKKVATILARSGLSVNGYGSKRLLHILKTLPRDDLFQASTDELYELATRIADLQERPVIRLFARRDMFNRFVSCLVYVPRDNFSTDLRLLIQQILMEEFHGLEVTATPSYSESLLARVHCVIRIDSQKVYEVDVDAIERKIIQVATSWHDQFRTYLIERYGQRKALIYYDCYFKAFSAGYRENYHPAVAAQDVDYLEKLTPSHPLEVCLHMAPEGSRESMVLKLFQEDYPTPLSDILPMLENMGLRVLREQSSKVRLCDQRIVWASDFGVNFTLSQSLNLDERKAEFQSSFAKIWHGAAENDRFNGLILSAGMDWRSISMFRAYARHLRQLGFALSESYIQQALVNHPDIAGFLLDLFELRFNPALHFTEANQQKIIETILKSLDAVDNLDEDRILHRFMDMMLATLRTNFYQRTAEGELKNAIALKFNSADIPDIPLPAPMFEVFVYSPRVEGIHLRADKVARGGLRWSDRREDFRVEVLGLMKAQQVKNSLIVPAGAKGGFVPKLLPDEGSRDDIMAEGIACYKDFISSLLDITDNLVAGKVVKPKDTVCHDEDDPYLVVAADKGTATFSDIANGIAADYGFWLDDAFASGGSAGYDHKKMGITARGAWESVKHHFKEAGLSMQKPFTVIGIGDMAGDVFGNGMLLSDKIKLVAAFNHKHIFLDPQPNPASSFKERKRLFEMVGSSWSDYNPKLISSGGGVHSRSSKWIKLSPEMQALLKTEEGKMMPNDLINALLKLPVDLLWNGGIGTYVKASHETHAVVGDRANDALRVDGSELGCKVVGEGGNLGLTQLGRVEFALHGGRVNTDFIDNSAGVDCSDHEVNIKILLNGLVANGKMSLKQRNKLLECMTDDVAELVLSNNCQQNTALSLALAQLPQRLNLYLRFMERHERDGVLNRKIEFLPDEKQIFARQESEKKLTRPELAVLLSYSKILLKRAILASDLPEDEAMAGYVQYVFPQALRHHYTDLMQQHYLRREIIATQLASQFVADMGLVYVQQMRDVMNVNAPQILRAYVAVRRIFDVDALYKELAKADEFLDVQKQEQILVAVRTLLRRSTRWLLRSHSRDVNIKTVVADFRTHISHLRTSIIKYVSGDERVQYDKMVDELMGLGVPRKTTQTIASVKILYPALNIVESAMLCRVDPSHMIGIYFTLSKHLELDWLRSALAAITSETRWDMLEAVNLRGELDKCQRDLVAAVYQFGHKKKKSTEAAEELVMFWSQAKGLYVDRWINTLADAKHQKTLTFTAFSVVLRELSALAQDCIEP